MGRMQATDMAEIVPDLHTLLVWHLQHNHYPPVPLAMVQPCHEAMDAVIADEPDTLVDMPTGTLWRGNPQAPAWAIVDALHLHTFVEQQGGY
jgi:hypothetical protein